MESAIIPAQSQGVAINEKPGKLLKKACKFVYALYHQQRSTDFYYHTYARAYEVVESCQEMAKALGLNPVNRQILLLSAWFVDTGFIHDYQDSSQDSTAIAETFLLSYDYPPQQLEQVIACINSVRDRYPPTSTLGEAFQDGYRLYLAQKDYIGRIELLRSEQEQQLGQLMSDAEWTKQCLDDFTQHPFYTDYAQQKYSKQRAENWLLIDRKLRKLTLKAKQNEKPSQQHLLSDRELEDSFKLTSRNYVDLLGVADRKAALLINVSSILISIVLAVLIRHMDDNPRLVLPTSILLIVCLATITFAILASRPTRRKVIHGYAKEEHTLFLGSFDNIDPVFERTTWADYEMQVAALRLKPKEEYLKQVLQEIFQTRKLLSRKFRFLSVSYYTFIIGMAATTIAYVLAMLLQ